MMLPGNDILKVATKEEIALLVEAAEAYGEADHYAGKRHDTRIADGMQLEVTTEPKKPTASWPVGMHDISDSGVSFWSKRDIPLFQRVYIREFSPDNSRTWIPTLVKHRTIGIRGNLIGTAFETVAPEPLNSYDTTRRVGPA